MTTVKLSDICTIKYGKDHKALADGPYPVYGSGGVIRRVEKSLSFGPSVLIPRKGTLSNLFYVDSPFWTVDTLFWTQIDEHAVNARYLYYLLLTKDLASLNVGTAVPSLTSEILNELAFELPDMKIQRKIVALLASIDSKIDINSRLNDYLLELLRTYARNLYRDYESNPERDLPKGWRWVEIGELADMVCRGIAPKYDETSDELVLGQTCIRNNLVLTENGSSHSPKRITEKWLQRNDVLINSTGVGSLGRTAQLWFDPSKLVVDSHVTIVRATNPRCALYLGFWMFGHEKYIESLHTGSTGQIELPKDRVKTIRIILPDEEELERFNAIAQPTVGLIVSNQSSSAKLASLRDTLLPKLMSGEINLSQVDLTQLNNHLPNWHWFIARSHGACDRLDTFDSAPIEHFGPHFSFWYRPCRYVSKRARYRTLTPWHATDSAWLPSFSCLSVKATKNVLAKRHFLHRPHTMRYPRSYFCIPR